MNSTIEVVLLVNAVLYFCACWLACSLSSVVFDVKRSMLISWFATVVLMLFYRHNGCFVLIELVAAFLISKKKWQNLLQFELCRLFFVVFGWKVAGGIIAGYILFVPSYSRRWIIMLLLVLTMTFMLVIAIHWVKRKQSYIKVKVMLGKKECWVNGFLDSGNLLEYKQIPVIFMSDQYYPYCESLKCDWICYTTIASNEETCVYLIQVEINRQYKPVYVAFSSELKGSMECLLNEKLFD